MAESDTDLHSTTESTSNKQESSLSSRYGGLGIVFAAAAVMIAIGWRRWSDLMIDYGSQLYVPWRLAEGDVLYRDVFHIYGPLSSYIHAVIFKVFGPGAMHLVYFNILLTALFAVLLYSMAYRLSDRLTATVATLGLVTVNALGQPRHLGNYNFIQPYNYDLTHGMMLSFVALHQVLRYQQAPTTPRLCGIGLLLGLIYLTKIEIMAAVGPAAAVGLLLAFAVHKMPLRSWLLNTGIAFFLFIVPSAVSILIFAIHMPLEESLSHWLTPWVLAFNPDIHDFLYFTRIRGTDELGVNLTRTFLYSGVLVLLVSGALGLNRLVEAKKVPAHKVAWLVLAALFALLLLYFRDIPWKLFLQPMPFILIGLGIYLAVLLRKEFRPTPEFFKYAGLLVLTVFSLLLLLKVFFKVVVYHYGFALTLPGTLVLCILLLHFIPNRLRTRCGPPLFYRTVAAGLMVFYIFALDFASYSFFTRKVVPVAQGPDMLYDYHPKTRLHLGKPYMKALMIKYALEVMESEMKPGAPVLVWPDALMINYLSRRPDPLGGFILNPFTWVLYGGDAPLLEKLKAQPPPYIMLIDRNYYEFQMPWFGTDFGQDIHHWIRDRYIMFKQIGAAPFTASGFGVQFFKLRPETNHANTD